jgi:hypothetical protein
VSKNSPPASVFALRAAPRHVARAAKIAEKKIKQALCVLSGEIEYQIGLVIGEFSDAPF